jgi:hypothetical protein
MCDRFEVGGRTTQGHSAKVIQFGHGPDLVKRYVVRQCVCNAMRSLNGRGAELAITQDSVALSVGGGSPDHAWPDHGSARAIGDERSGSLSEAFRHDDVYGFGWHDLYRTTPVTNRRPRGMRKWA